MPFVGAVDQGTTSTRFMVFDAEGREVARHQLEHEQIMTQPGWVEHDPLEIAERTNDRDRRGAAARRADRRGISSRSASPISARRRSCGIQRPAVPGTTPSSGRTRGRTGSSARSIARRAAASSASAPVFRLRPTSPAPSSSGSSRTSTACAKAAERGEAVFGTVDTWVIWNLTGGVDGGAHVTDVTNASRTMLMNLKTLDWDDELLGAVRRAAGDAADDPAVIGSHSRTA